MKKSLLLILFAGLLTLPVAAAETAKPLLHGLFTDHMVLQRDARAPVWGWDEPGAEVSVTFKGRTYRTEAGDDGKWMVKLAKADAGGPYTLIVDGTTDATLHNVMVGDVWICSGQSNMQWGMGQIDAPEYSASAHYPNIRLFYVPRVTANSPRENVDAQWRVCSPDTLYEDSGAGFSAVAYFFGRKLHTDLDVPIGLIHTSWGGTIAEAWTSAEALLEMEDFAPAVKAILEARDGDENSRAAIVDRWYQRVDAGSKSGANWASDSSASTDWKTMKVPGAWENGALPGFDGVVWFQKTVDIPQTAAGKDATLHLGPVDDRDTVYFNGVRIGGKDVWTEARTYTVPGNAVRAGENLLAVRVLDTGGGGGFMGDADQLRLEADGRSIPLAGDWKYQVGVAMADAGSPPPAAQGSNPNVVTVLYNAMIAPLVPYGIKGAIWYQGESNASRAAQYQELLPTLINDWRERFDVGRFPFLIVQLANFMATQPEPGESDWAELREAQSMTAKNMRNVGLAVTIDIGEADDIHPKNKWDVGERLALNALAIGHNRDVVHSGPVYRSMKVERGAIRLRFDHVGGGLVAKGGELEGFAIAGEDGKFVWADARIDGDTVVVSADSVTEPKAVRYAWANNPVCNLYNEAGLPASPFRTDAD